MTEEKFIIDGFEFQTRSDYMKAKKEQEAVLYMKEKSEWELPKVALKIYNKLLDNNTFHTIIGYEFLKDLRRIVISGNVIEENYLRNIVIPDLENGKNPSSFQHTDEAKKYKELYENALSGRLITKIIIGFLIVIIIGMNVITYQRNNSSVLSNYEEQIVNKYEDWQTSLEKKEKDLEQREQAIEEREDNLN